VTVWPRTQIVLIASRDGNRLLGTGTIITKGRVLTARHVVFGKNGPKVELCIGDPSDSASAPATILWVGSESLDVAVLDADVGVEQDLRASLSTRELTPGAVWEARGYLKVRAVESSKRLEVITGTTASYTTNDTFLSLDANVRPDEWGGLSGAAVGVKGHLVGVVRAIPTGWSGGRIEAIPVAAFLTDPSFREAVGLVPLTRSDTLSLRSKHAFVGRVEEVADLEALLLGPAASPRVAPASAGSPRPFLSTVPSTLGEPPFLGREVELASVRRALGSGRIAIVAGASGRGKTRLTREYAATAGAEYPGGMYWVNCEGHLPTDLAFLLRLWGKPEYVDEKPEQACLRALHEIGRGGRCLLVYDAVPDETWLRRWMPNQGLDWHLVVTSTSLDWTPGYRDKIIGLDALNEGAARSLVQALLADAEATRRFADAIVERARGVTIELCSLANSAAKRIRQGRTIEIPECLAKETDSSFGAAWSLLSYDAQLAIRVAAVFQQSRIPIEVVLGALSTVSSNAQDALYEAADRSLATVATEHVELHALVANFAHSKGVLEPGVRRGLFAFLSRLARDFAERLGDQRARARFALFPLGLEVWRDILENPEDVCAIGSALVETGKTSEALLWYGCAIQIAKDTDSASLPACLMGASRCEHQLGNMQAAERLVLECLAKLKELRIELVNPETHADALDARAHLHRAHARMAEAVESYHQAIDYREAFKPEPRLHHKRLGQLYQLLGTSYAQLGDSERATEFYFKAIAEKSIPDPAGRVDNLSISISYSALGAAAAAQNQWPAAQDWYEKAAAAGAKGDIYERVSGTAVGQILTLLAHAAASSGDMLRARRICEEALHAFERGDIHGKVDQEAMRNVKRARDMLFQPDSKGQYERKRELRTPSGVVPTLLLATESPDPIAGMAVPQVNEATESAPAPWEFPLKATSPPSAKSKTQRGVPEDEYEATIREIFELELRGLDLDRHGEMLTTLGQAIFGQIQTGSASAECLRLLRIVEAVREIQEVDAEYRSPPPVFTVDRLRAVADYVFDAMGSSNAATIVARAEEEARASLLLEFEDVDLWRPGMLSGSGRTEFVQLSPKGKRLLRRIDQGR
jgi:tetratricopeptide (TPR) repeat protein